ncbi:MAG: tRNA (cytidine(34)-2'-O)-methyltransferase [Bdellovibrionia bacterium]
MVVVEKKGDPVPRSEQVPKPDFHYHIVLFEPEIPPNTGNAGRLCVATQCTLHLVGKLGFSIDDKQVRRAGLDYWKFVDLHQHENFEAWLGWFRLHEPEAPFYFLETGTHRTLYEIEIPKRAAFIFGKETVGFPKDILQSYPDQTFILPMFSSRIRSLNLSNAVSITLYEAIRQALVRPSQNHKLI